MVCCTTRCGWRTGSRDGGEGSRDERGPADVGAVRADPRGDLLRAAGPGGVRGGRAARLLAGVLRRTGRPARRRSARHRWSPRSSGSRRTSWPAPSPTSGSGPRRRWRCGPGCAARSTRRSSVHCGRRYGRAAVERRRPCCTRRRPGWTTPGGCSAAANAALPEPDEPLARLWQAATVLREHRGDGHVAALVGAGVDRLRGAGLAGRHRPAPRSCCSRRVAGRTRSGGRPTGRLARRGWLTADGRATAEGVAAYEAVEERPTGAPPGRGRRSARPVPVGSSNCSRPCPGVPGGMPTPNPIGLVPG